MMPDQTPKKALGQHWLDDTAALSEIAAAGDLSAKDYVLEIGPGKGALTSELINTGATVHALEFDSSLIPALTAKFPQVKVEEGDIRTYDLNQLPDRYKIVANIPYYLTANLMRLLTEPASHKPAKAVLLIQKEVAERVAARPGQMAFLSAAVQLYYAVGLGPVVPAEAFTPPPKVDSQVLILTRRAAPLYPDIDDQDFLRFIKIGFAQRRKTLLNNLTSGLRVGRDQVTAWAGSAGIEPGRRPQTLSLDEWRALYHAANT